MIRLGTIASAAATATLALGGAANAGVVSGTHGNLTWQATNYIVGQTSTATQAAGGDPRYFAPMPQYSGVAALIMNFENGSFICSGSLLPDRQSILTAAHCVTPDATSGALQGTTAYFYGGPNPDTVVPFNAASTAVSVSDVFIHPLYSGNVIDQNDIAVLRLGTVAPLFAASYGLSADNSLTGDGYNIAGYGGRSDTGGNLGANLGTGRLRQGDNRYDFRMGDADFAGGWELILGQPTSQIEYSYIADFDNGKAANDATCLVAADPFFGLGGPKYCDLGMGADEVSSAGGDSGGPQFDAAMNIMSITSYGLTFGIPEYGDVDGNLNSSFGEFNGFVPIYIHRDFILANMVSEPSSMLLAAMAGLALVGSRRRRVQP